MLTFSPIGLLLFIAVVVFVVLVIEHPEQWFDDYHKGDVKHGIKQFFTKDFFGTH